MPGIGGMMGRRQYLGLAAFVLVAMLAAISHLRYSRIDLASSDPLSATTRPLVPVPVSYTKPKDVKIIGLVFFGRRKRVELLRCFIERNLVENGGWLDEVHWVQNTEKEEDLAYLDEILASSPTYRKIALSDEERSSFEHAWEHLERGALYVKVDDDVVWFADDTIPRIVTLKLEHPEYLITSANVVNSPLMGWVHYHMGAMQPYLPEYIRQRPSEAPANVSWNWRDYPFWYGPSDVGFDIHHEPPFEGHRWLRLENESDMSRTPVTQIEYNTWGTGLNSWAIAAQSHYSFLENLAENRLDRYKFERAWTTDYERLSINFICLWADEVTDNLPMDEVDEHWLTVNLPKKLGKHVAVDGEALAVHMSFMFQTQVDSTDLLDRYHSYTMERVCK